MLAPALNTRTFGDNAARGNAKGGARFTLTPPFDCLAC